MGEMRVGDELRERMSVFWGAVLVGVAGVLPKIVYTPVPEEWGREKVEVYLRELVVITQSDVMFALVCGAIGGVLLLLSGRWGRGAYAMCMGVFAIFAAYSVVSYPVFMFLRSPLTYGLIDLYGWGKVPWLIVNLASWKIVVMTAGAAVAFLMLSGMANRGLRPRRELTFRAVQLMVIGVAVAQVMIIRHYWPKGWEDRDDRRIAENPHWFLMRSCWVELSGRGSVLINGWIEKEDLADFGRATTRPSTRPAPRPPNNPIQNVILVVLESVSTKYMSLYGSKYSTTPRLEAEARHALVFDNIYSPVTNSGNAMVAITLGYLPPMTWRELIVDRPGIPGVALGNVLKARGHRTAFISSCDFSYAEGLAFMSHRGFETLWDYRDLGCEKVGWWGVDDRCMIDSSLRWIDQDRSKPFFIMCWNQGTHHPFETGPSHREIDFFQGNVPHNDWDLGHYLNAIHHIDGQLGRLFDELRRRQLDQNTLVIILGDHGEAFGEPHPFYGHSGKVYQEDVNVPFILWAPGLYENRPRRHTIGNLWDTTPTAMDLMGIAAGEHEGESLFAEGRRPRTYFYGAREDYLLGLREHNWKFITNVTVGKDELYDLSVDPDEKKNLAGERPDLVKRYRQRVGAWVQFRAGVK